MASSPAPFSVSTDSTHCILSPPTSKRQIFGPTLKLWKIKHAHLRKLIPLRSDQGFALKASMGPPQLTKQLNNNNKRVTLSGAEDGCDIFNDLKHRFLSFKHKYMENIEQFEKLAKAQAPKGITIACGDSRVCPSNILGFQPGEAFIVRNVGNLVPPLESGPSETNAALEFAVNSLLIENILIIGHSCCGGIRALMSMQDDENASSFIKSWVIIGKNARIKAETVASNLSFDEQCTHCEKESINNSLSNLLTYPWIEEKVAKEELFVHGGYYNFIDCSFEKWTLDYRGTKLEENGRIAVKNKVFWS
ncbi:PREDICTED: beta carbonic anhydrase 5, chloroplastic-like [Lupinus angustifolius]|uniref:beta carbonic anhydrase 5, chloroplastic-like n=1 Tax=Lupinus angustifolius TaxID=3871 RepID=UPI00092E621E|nr:PREDICTED: beta carbonic anhydrase 5, chloroplastic-like [Lupinus angustifolius]